MSDQRPTEPTQWGVGGVTCVSALLNMKSSAHLCNLYVRLINLFAEGEPELD